MERFNPHVMVTSRVEEYSGSNLEHDAWIRRCMITVLHRHYILIDLSYSGKIRRCLEYHLKDVGTF